MGNSIYSKWEDLTGVTRRLLEGTYYSRAADVILLKENAQTETFGETDLDAIRRQIEHEFYATAIDAARRLDDERLIDTRDTRHSYNPDSDSRTSHSSQLSHELDSATARSRKRKMSKVAVGGRQESKAAEIAHLVPHNYNCANFFLLLVEAMTGIDFGGRRLSEMRRNMKLRALVHGTMEYTGKRRKLSLRKAKSLSRVHNTGVKHSRANMASVISQKAYFDTYPMLLIVPIMKLPDYWY